MCIGCASLHIHVDYPRELVRLCLKDVLADREPSHQSDKAGNLSVIGQEGLICLESLRSWAQGRIPHIISFNPDCAPRHARCDLLLVIGDTRIILLVTGIKLGTSCSRTGFTLTITHLSVLSLKNHVFVCVSMLLHICKHVFFVHLCACVFIEAKGQCQMSFSITYDLVI